MSHDPSPPPTMAEQLGAWWGHMRRAPVRASSGPRPSRNTPHDGASWRMLNIELGKEGV